MKNERLPIIVGLDIGTTKVIAIACAKTDNGRLEILAQGQAESAGVTNGVVLNIDDCANSIRRAVDNCIASNGDVDITDVYVGISGAHIKTLQTRGSRVRKNVDEEISQLDIDMLISEQYKTFIPATDQIVDIIPYDMKVDERPSFMKPIGMTGTRIEANFHIITCGKNELKNVKRSVAKAGLNIKEIFVQPIVNSEALLDVEDKEAGVVIVDIGGGTTDITVYYDGALKHTAVIPFGGNNITNDIRIGLGLLRSQAEQLKVIYGMAVSSGIDPLASITMPGSHGLQPKEISLKALSVLIEEAMQEIMDYVVYHLRHLGLDNCLNAGMILTGGGAQLKNIRKLAEQMTGMQVRVCNTKELLSESTFDSMVNPSYSSCLGLISRAYKNFRGSDLSFVHEDLDLHTAVVAPGIDKELVPDPLTTSVIIPLEEGKKAGGLKRIGTVLKDKFMRLFEEYEEVEMP